MSIYDFELKRADQKIDRVKTYENKVLLIVNTAMHCGFTPQYEGLEKLYQTYKDEGFEILDFPCNQFANQTPESDDEINKICELSYQTTFKRYAKINVNGKNADPFFQYLKRHAPHELNAHLKQEGFFAKLIFNQRIKWNFTKFLVDRQGKVIARFSPKVKPDQMIPYIEKALKKAQ